MWCFKYPQCNTRCVQIITGIFLFRGFGESYCPIDCRIDFRLLKEIDQRICIKFCVKNEINCNKVCEMTSKLSINHPSGGILARQDRKMLDKCDRI